MTTTSAPSPTPSPRAASRPRPRTRVRAVIVAGAVLAALTVWAVASPLLGVELRAAPDGGDPMTVGPPAVVTSSLLAASAGWALLALLERVTARAGRVWSVIAVAVLLASLAGPPAGVSAGATAALTAMHLAVGAVLIPLLPRAAHAAGAA